MPCTSSAGLLYLLNLKQVMLNKDIDKLFKSAVHFKRECDRWLRACFKVICLLKQPMLLQDCSPQQEFTSLKWKETRLQKTFINMFEYLTLDHHTATHKSPLERKELFPCRRRLLARWVLALVTTQSVAGLSVMIVPTNLSFLPFQLLSQLSFSKLISYFCLVLHYVNLKAGCRRLFQFKSFSSYICAGQRSFPSLLSF